MDKGTNIQISIGLCLWYEYINIPITILGPPLWSSDYSSWLQIQRSGFNSRRYHIFWEAVSLERCPFNFLSTDEEILGRKSSGSGLERREYGRRDPLCWPRGTLYPQNLALTSPTSGVRSVGIVKNSGHCPSQQFGDWILSPSWGGIQSVGLSPRANSTDQATAASRRS
jgi:hypothetical protein